MFYKMQGRIIFLFLNILITWKMLLIQFETNILKNNGFSLQA